MPVVPHIPSMGCLLFFVLVVEGPFLLCLLIISSLVPREEKKAVIFYEDVFI